MKAIITVGISGSGKSTWAEKMLDTSGCASLSLEPEIVNINRDETRWLLSGKCGWNGPNAYKFMKVTEKQVTEINNDKIVMAAKAGKDVIISDTHLNENRRKEVINFLTFLGYQIEIKEFPISFQEACRRDKERGIYSVGEAVLMKQWKQWVQYWEEKQQGAW